MKRHIKNRFNQEISLHIVKALIQNRKSHEHKQGNLPLQSVAIHCIYMWMKTVQSMSHDFNTLSGHGMQYENTISLTTYFSLATGFAASRELVQCNKNVTCDTSTCSF